MSDYEEELARGDVPNMSDETLIRLLGDMLKTVKMMEGRGFFSDGTRAIVPTRIWDEMERRQLPEFYAMRDAGKIIRITLGLAQQSIFNDVITEFIDEPGIYSYFEPEYEFSAN